jgi:hypothetical protein
MDPEVERMSSAKDRKAQVKRGSSRGVFCKAL